jgi:anti-sigma factor RsiW
MMNHRVIGDLFPWYLNGTLGGPERQRVDGHVRECSTCRDELAKDRRIYQEMGVEPSVEYMPAPSRKHLQAAIRGLGAEHPPSSRPPAARRLAPSRRLATASIAVATLALALLTAGRWGHSRGPDDHTDGASSAHPQGEVIRAVFAPTVTLAELQGILAEAQLRIISGPTEAAVYSLAATSVRPASAALTLLRSHPQVRFAQHTQRELPAGARDAPPREAP